MLIHAHVVIWVNFSWFHAWIWGYKHKRRSRWKCFWKLNFRYPCVRIRFKRQKDTTMNTIWIKGRITHRFKLISTETLTVSLDVIFRVQTLEEWNLDVYISIFENCQIRNKLNKPPLNIPKLQHNDRLDKRHCFCCTEHQN